jgi:hypothetical protein
VTKAAVVTGYGIGVFEQHAALLRASAIAPDVARERGYASVDTKTRLAQAGFAKSQQQVPGLLIPVHGVDGTVGTYEYRPDAPRVTDAGRTLKYEKPFGSVNRLDVHPRVRARLGDPSVTLWITEGARKVDAAVTAGLCCVGIAGVWGWRGTNGAGGKVALADWESVALNGRGVVCAFDSDVMTKPEVHKALDSLGRFLTARGARVRFCILPGTDGKCGLDDFLVEHGVDELIVVDELPNPNGQHVQDELGPVRAPAQPCALDDVVAEYRRWLHLPDDGQVLFALAVVAANLAPGDPVWGLVVGASGSGKTETIAPAGALEYVHATSSVTGEAALLSATGRRDRERHASGGLLRQIGDFGILLIRDFSGVLSMHRDARAQVVAALREVFDGQWTRPVGTGGGQTLEWHGKCGFLGAVTPSIDRHHAVMGALGERFVLYRIETEPAVQARRRLANRGHEREMREKLGDAICGLFAGIDANCAPRPFTDAEVAWLVALAVFVVRARTPVERDGYNHDVLVMPSQEAPGRLVGSVGQLLTGLETIGAKLGRAYEIVTKTAWDCVPDIRRRILRHLHETGETLRTAQLVTATGIPKNTIERALEDLALIGLVAESRSGDHEKAAKTWTLTDDTVDTWPAPSPETSDNEYRTDADNTTPTGSLNDSLLSDDDISGEVTTTPPAMSPTPLWHSTAERSA